MLTSKRLLNDYDRVIPIFFSLLAVPANRCLYAKFTEGKKYLKNRKNKLFGLTKVIIFIMNCLRN